MRNVVAGPVPAPPEPRKRAMLPGWLRNEMFVLQGAATDADLAARAITELSEADFHDPVLRRVYVALRALFASGAPVTVAGWVAGLRDDTAAVAALHEALGRDVPEGDSAAAALDRLVARRREEEYRRLREEARRSGALRSADDAELKRRLAELERFHRARYARSKDAAIPSDGVEGS